MLWFPLAKSRLREARSSLPTESADLSHLLGLDRFGGTQNLTQVEGPQQPRKLLEPKVRNPMPQTPEPMWEETPWLQRLVYQSTQELRDCTEVHEKGGRVHYPKAKMRRCWQILSATSPACAMFKLQDCASQTTKT